jgi:hypothetical protein
MTNKEQSAETEIPSLVIDDKTLKCMALAEYVANEYKSLPNSTYATDSAAVAYGVLQAQMATNQLLVTLFTTINDGFKGFDLLMSDIMKAMNGDTGGF